MLFALSHTNLVANYYTFYVLMGSKKGRRHFKNEIFHLQATSVPIEGARFGGMFENY